MTSDIDREIERLSSEIMDLDRAIKSKVAARRRLEDQRFNEMRQNLPKKEGGASEAPPERSLTWGRY